MGSGDGGGVADVARRGGGKHCVGAGCLRACADISSDEGMSLPLRPRELKAAAVRIKWRVRAISVALYLLRMPSLPRMASMMRCTIANKDKSKSSPLPPLALRLLSMAKRCQSMASWLAARRSAGALAKRRNRQNAGVERRWWLGAGQQMAGEVTGLGNICGASWHICGVAPVACCALPCCHRIKNASGAYHGAAMLFCKSENNARRLRRSTCASLARARAGRINSQRANWRARAVVTFAREGTYLSPHLWLRTDSIIATPQRVLISKYGISSAERVSKGNGIISGGIWNVSIKQQNAHYMRARHGVASRREHGRARRDVLRRRYNSVSRGDIGGR
jgi:hypothetical protein